jgi:hypothetical protein
LTKKDPNAPSRRIWQGTRTIDNPEYIEYEKNKKANQLKRAKEETKRRNEEAKERERIAAGRTLAEENPEPERLKAAMMAPLTQVGSYTPWVRPRKPGSPPCIFDNPPDIVDSAREVFDRMSQMIPDPDALGALPYKQEALIRYCFVQGWLIQNDFTNMSSEWERYSNKVGHSILYPNPQFNQWLVASKHSTYLENYIFDKAAGKNARKAETLDDEPSGITAKDFPLGMRDAATAAAKMIEGRDISKLMPYAVVIGKKADSK